MFSFTAHFYENEIYLNGKFAYNNNEFLTELLNLAYFEDLLSYRDTLIKKTKYLKLFGKMSEFEIEDYNKHVQSIQSAMNNMNCLFDRLSISKFIFAKGDIYEEQLFDLLSSEEWIWKYSDSVDELSDEDDDNFVNSYGFSYKDVDSFGNEVYRSQLNKFVPFELKYSVDADMGENLDSLNSKVEKLCNEYLTFAEDILRVTHLYFDFVDNFLNAKHKFLDSNDLANTFIDFIEKTKNNPSRNYLKFTSGYSKFFHSVIKKDKTNILCESYDFSSLGAFLYFDLFRGVYSNYIPKKCDNCEKYFLIKSGKYTDYCENTSPQDKSKTCREVGSRKKYDDKCKTDPVWQTYNRAYKAHYARYMKKKMTISEFEKWSAWAVEWRTKAENDEISLEEYIKEIKK